MWVKNPHGQYNVKELMVSEFKTYYKYTVVETGHVGKGKDKRGYKREPKNGSP